MSITTTYKCDKCGKEQDTNSQFWNVGVTANCQSTPVQPQYLQHYVTGLSMQVCRPCLEGFGIHVQKKKEEEQQPKTPTLEELIIDIVMNAEINNR